MQATVAVDENAEWVGKTTINIRHFKEFAGLKSLNIAHLSLVSFSCLLLLFNCRLYLEYIDEI